MSDCGAARVAGPTPAFLAALLIAGIPPIGAESTASFSLQGSAREQNKDGELGGSVRFQVLRELSPPNELLSATDVRWLSDSLLLVGAQDRGVYSWEIGTKTLRFVARSQDGPQDYGRIAGSSGGYTVFSGLLFGYFRHAGERVELEIGFELVGDLDRRGADTLIVGLKRPGGGPSRYEDHIVWLVADGDRVPRGLLLSTDQGQGMDWCAGAELPVVRFVSKDRIVVVPGAEHGVFVLDREGSVLGTVQASLLGAESGCRISREQMFSLSDPAFATAWLAKRRIIDEVVSDERGNLFFFVRSVSHQQPVSSTANNRARPKVCWDLVHAHVNDLRKVQTLACVVESDVESARLRADLRDSRALIILRGDRGRILEARLTFS